MKKKPFCFKSKSAAETRSFGKKLGQFLIRGDIVSLRGDLGAGKTTLTKGIAAGLGIQKGSEVSSPTFVVVHEYQGREKIYHMDWYRLEEVAGADRELAEECFSSGAVTLIEWPERGEKILPKDRLEIRIKHLSESGRMIELSGRGTAKARLEKFLK